MARQSSTSILRRTSTALPPQKSREDALREQQDAYFSELLSYSLERLSKEPELLRVDQEQIRRSMQESAVTRYRAFIDTARCLQTVKKEMEDVAVGLDSLLEDLPTLTTSCDTFQDAASSILVQQTKTKELYNNHSVLLELLEVPQLMDTCVRNGNYDEALDLKAFVDKLAFMHSGLSVVQLLFTEVNGISQNMLQQLLQKLQNNIQLPECLRVIGYLRRLSAFSEQELRLRFLQAREHWLDTLTADLDPSDPYDFLKRLTDLNRLHLFDIVMQFRAIFSDDNLGQESTGDGGILYSWAHHRMCLYIDAISAHLPRMSDGGSVSSVCDHCMYCGMSLGRMGLDFRALITPMFELSIIKLVSKAVVNSVDSFSVSLDVHKWVAMPSASRDRRAAAAAATNMGNAARKGLDSDDVTPPASLMEHTPLAIFANGMLAAVNELRHCAPLSMKNKVAAMLQEALEQVSSRLVNYGVTRVLDDGEYKLYTACCKSYIDVLVPYLSTCFTRVYPGSGGTIDTLQLTAPLKEALRQREALREVDLATEGSLTPAKSTPSVSSSPHPTHQHHSARADTPPIPNPSPHPTPQHTRPTTPTTVPAASSPPPLAHRLPPATEEA